MASTALFSNIERGFPGFGSWLRRVSPFCSLRVHLETFILPLISDSYAHLYCFLHPPPRATTTITHRQINQRVRKTLLLSLR